MTTIRRQTRRDQRRQQEDRGQRRGRHGHAAAGSPEDVFLSWLLWLPADADPREAAHAEIARIDTSSSSSPEVRRLRSLFETLARSDG